MVIIHLGNNSIYHELHVKQFDLLLEEQSFSHRRNEDTEEVERSSFRILSDNCVDIPCYIHKLVQLYSQTKVLRYRNELIVVINNIFIPILKLSIYFLLTFVYVLVKINYFVYF